MELHRDNIPLYSFTIKCNSCKSTNVALVLETVYGEYQGVIIECKKCGNKENV